ncbi:hypothetical protein SNE40_012471 [Patella caerulea]|uniref:COX assembly mitochondrial protein n=1 Tax=Patella caerulea TaxID=87958 RepID=A0AAN8JLY2_PATCE
MSTFNLNPVIYTDLTKRMQGWVTWQSGPCADFEMDLYRCGSRVGYGKVYEVCNKEREDMFECLNHSTQYQRYKIMQEERKKQGRPYLDPPPMHVPGFNKR